MAEKHLDTNTVFEPDAFSSSLASGNDPLTVFQEALQHGREVLRSHYYHHGNPEEIVYNHAWLVDQLLISAWSHLGKDPESSTGLSLIAVGGYGRGELHPYSDIDLLILSDDDIKGASAEFIEHFIRFLWDMRLEVGHSCRSVKTCIQEAKTDLTVITNLMEARLLAGDAGLFETLRKNISLRKMWPSKKFFQAKLTEQAERIGRFGDTAYRLEPNIKESPGGLRDIQMIVWIAQRHLGIESLQDLVDQEVLSETEYATLVEGRNFLWHIRNGIHYLSQRKEDRLLFDHQRKLATELGFKDKKTLAVEQLMKQYYSTVKELSVLNEIMLQHFRERILISGRARKRGINDRFVDYQGYIAAANDEVFTINPSAILEMFLLLQNSTKLVGVRAHTIRLLRAALPLIDDQYRNNPETKRLFMKILGQPTGVTHELRRMNNYGVLGAYIPAFGKIVGQMQHDLFHVYTVDEHSLFVLRNLRRFGVAEFSQEFPLASSIIRKLVKPERLYIAGLFHDLAKGRGGDHSELGSEDALTFCKSHEMSDYDAGFVSWLVRNHLLMSWTAQREDTSDPEVVIRFASKVGDQEHLDNLYLLTVADIRGTSPKVWNDWKGHLLIQLYKETTQVLLYGAEAISDIDKHVAQRKNGALEALRLPGSETKKITRHWNQMENSYFLQYDTDTIAWHVESLVMTSSLYFPIVATRFNPTFGGSEFFVYMPNSDDLFSRLTGAFDYLNLSVIDARVHSTRQGFALDTFIVLDHDGNPIEDARALKHLQESLREELLSTSERPQRQSNSVSRQLKHFPIETAVKFAETASHKQTIMEITAQDRPGLLYQVSMALNTCGVRLSAAKVSTFGERAEDVFFIVDRDNKPIDSADQRQCLENEITQRLFNDSGKKKNTPNAIQI